MRARSEWHVLDYDEGRDSCGDFGSLWRSGDETTWQLTSWNELLCVPEGGSRGLDAAAVQERRRYSGAGNSDGNVLSW